MLLMGNLEANHLPQRTQSSQRIKHGTLLSVFSVACI